MTREITDLSCLDRMDEIERASFISPWAKEDIKNDLLKRNGVSRYMGVYEGEILVGWGCVFLLGEEAHLGTVSVLPEYRRKGYGRELTIALMELSKEEGTQYMQLECRRSNTAAQQMYLSLGFFRFSIRKGYYSDTGEDAFLYARLFSQIGG